ncbi:hypothetical protein [Thalassospira povalilytica]|uniref:hypothetical protein n=1 Tax=Thalassospira povalilytica TaxID=732237 RepID=UPI003AA8D47C
MNSIIRLSKERDWGTAFAVKQAGKLRFITAAHVLKACGIPIGAQQGTVDMCDQLDLQFLTGPKQYQLTNIVWEECGDYVEFDSTFNAAPFSKGSPPKVGAQLKAIGYLLTYDHKMPDCGVIVDYQASLANIAPWRDCSLKRAELDIQSMVADLVGMSGCPIIDEAGDVIAFLVGTLENAGGPPYQATLLS